MIMHTKRDVEAAAGIFQSHIAMSKLEISGVDDVDVRGHESQRLRSGGSIGGAVVDEGGEVRVRGRY